MAREKNQINTQMQSGRYKGKHATVVIKSSKPVDVPPEEYKSYVLKAFEETSKIDKKVRQKWFHKHLAVEALDGQVQVLIGFEGKSKTAYVMTQATENTMRQLRELFG